MRTSSSTCETRDGAAAKRDVVEAPCHSRSTVDRVEAGTAECEAIGATPHAVEGYRWLAAAHERAGVDAAALEACREGVELARSLADAAGEATEWLYERREELESGEETDVMPTDAGIRRRAR